MNLVLLGLVFYFALGTQFRFGPDWLLSGSANERVDALSDLILAELNVRPRNEWTSILDRFNKAYQLEFILCREDGALLAGQAVPFPPEVTRRFPPVRRPVRRRGFAEVGPPLPPEAGENAPPIARRLGPPPGRGGLRIGEGPPPGSPARGRMEGPRPKAVVRTASPTRYWLLVPTALDNTEPPGWMPVTLVIVSKTASGGGLFFDYKPWVGAGLGAIVVSALFWFPLVRGMTRAVKQVTSAAQKIAQGHFDVRVNDRRQDELGELGQSINRMAGRLEGFVQGQKRFLGDIAHELCSPLAKLRVALGILDQRTAEAEKGYLAAANEKAEQMAQLVNELLSFSKASLSASTIKLRPVAVRAVVESAVRREAHEVGVVETDVPTGLVVEGEPELLGRALANLVRNALRYAGHAGPIIVSARTFNGQVELSVADSGPGVPESELPKLFDPFYRVDVSRDRATGGVGLGLSIVKTCVESCRGTVSCHNRQPSGLEFVIRLKAVSAS